MAMLADFASLRLALSEMSAQIADWSAWYSPRDLIEFWTCSAFMALIRDGMIRSSL
jgi:hypothetical protein